MKENSEHTSVNEWTAFATVYVMKKAMESFGLLPPFVDDTIAVCAKATQVLANVGSTESECKSAKTLLDKAQKRFDDWIAQELYMVTGEGRNNDN